MGSIDTAMEFPEADFPSLQLTSPTPAEKHQIWTLNSVNWGTALPLSCYIEREKYLTTVPLARNSGITHWILVDSSLPPDQRPILASAESLCKPALVSHNGVVEERMTHGIGSVFSPPKYRGRGYAARMLKELATILRSWQIDADTKGKEEIPFSILYSDIGKKYYAKFGWEPFPSSHIALPSAGSPPLFKKNATPLSAKDIPALCVQDVESIRTSLRQSTGTRVSLIPNSDQMAWHHSREDFVTRKLFKNSPTIKGAIIGTQGSRIWAVWTRAFYGPVQKKDSGNAFHILRLVVEDETDTEENVEKLKAILEMAKEEARQWNLNTVDFWNPSETVKTLVRKTGLEHVWEERESESIASLMWYRDEKPRAGIQWVNNEKFGWC